MRVPPTPSASNRPLHCRYLGALEGVVGHTGKELEAAVEQLLHHELLFDTIGRNLQRGGKEKSGIHGAWAALGAAAQDGDTRQGHFANGLRGASSLEWGYEASSC